MPVVTQVVRAGKAVAWYVRELMGDTAYQRYLARFAVEHHDHEPLSEREFWRQRIDNQPMDSRCC
ncbi:MAG: YbdD/YjiX family protein [Propionibacteriaceae bacterium]|nr:YbdD/YjiX family protein [Propionibacteriaceae bacterium]